MLKSTQDNHKKSELKLFVCQNCLLIQHSINLKSEKYLELMKNKEFSELNLENIDEELGFKKLNEKECCEDNTCCCV